MLSIGLYNETNVLSDHILNICSSLNMLNAIDICLHHESECHVIMSCPLYNGLRGELFTHEAQFEPNFNNLNDDEIFFFLFSATDICFYTAKTCFNILTVRRKMLYNTK